MEVERSKEEREIKEISDCECSSSPCSPAVFLATDS